MSAAEREDSCEVGAGLLDPYAVELVCLRAENERLREALTETMAILRFEFGQEDEPDNQSKWRDVDAFDAYQLARAALAAHPPEHG